VHGQTNAWIATPGRGISAARFSSRRSDDEPLGIRNAHRTIVSDIHTHHADNPVAGNLNACDHVHAQQNSYRGARCVVYASLYEGFGLPVLEAMASGTPVVTSRGGATEEIAGGAAVLVDPLDPESIAAGIAGALERRAQLVPLGLERARGFTWVAAADAVETLWRELA